MLTSVHEDQDNLLECARGLNDDQRRDMLAWVYLEGEIIYELNKQRGSFEYDPEIVALA